MQIAGTNMMHSFRNTLSRLAARLGQGHRRGSLGQSVAEFALIVPVALLLMGGALDLGRLFYARVSIENAAREGAFFGASNPRCDTPARSLCADPDTADWRVRNEVVGLGTLNVGFSCSSGGSPVAMTSCQSGDMYEASVSTGFDLVTPLLMPILGTELTLDATATAVVFDDAFDPTASPQPVASMEPVCWVPDLIGMLRNPARDAWVAAGFAQQNLGWPGMNANDIVATQSLPAGGTEPCATAHMTVTK